ncbi:MAG TPA: DUF2336 domain-containing protein [Pseudolabrys sp.]|nr:DUF2336 domain-containing protein [Pseudolabrys sp.]
MGNFQTLIADLETAIHEGQQDKRVAILRQVTDLFVLGAASYTEEHVEVFGDVLARLADRVENKVLAELSGKLAPVANAPNAIIQNLARHDEISVAGPVLSQSPRLSEADLVEIARSKGQKHLGAISERAKLASAVTDILVERGDDSVVLKLSRNNGASFSNAGFNRLSKRAEDNAQLAQNLSIRVDLPPTMLRDLMTRATEEVRARLLAGSSPEARSALQKAIDEASAAVASEAAAPRDFRRAEKLIDSMKAHGQLEEATIVGFANSGEYEKMVVAMARLGLAPVSMIDQIVQTPSYEGLLTACKACDFSWKTFSAVLNKRFPGLPMPTAALDEACAEFHKMSSATAKRIYRFWLVQGVAKQSTTH